LDIFTDLKAAILVLTETLDGGHDGDDYGDDDNDDDVSDNYNGDEDDGSSSGDYEIICPS